MLDMPSKFFFFFHQAVELFGGDGEDHVGKLRFLPARVLYLFIWSLSVAVACGCSLCSLQFF